MAGHLAANLLLMLTTVARRWVHWYVSCAFKQPKLAVLQLTCNQAEMG